MRIGSALTLVVSILAAGAPAIGAPDRDVLPLMVGGCAHGETNIEALADLDMGNFVWLPAHVYATSNIPWDEHNDILRDVDTCVHRNLRFMFSERRGLGDTLRAGGYDYGGHADEFIAEKTVREIVRHGGNLLVGAHAEELDADLIQNALRPSFRTRSPELYQYKDREGGRLAFEGELARLQKRYHSWGVPFIPNLCVTFQHSGFRTQADIVIAELLEHLPTTELQLAYLRGGARQFGGPWGVWVSPWWIGKIPTEDKALWPIEQAQVGGGHSASSFRRCLYLSFVSGARLLCCQDTPPLLSREQGGGYQPGPWGRELVAFWRYAHTHDAPLTPTVPLAALVDRDNGWAPAQMWINWTLADTVWGKLPTDRSDRMLTGYLDVLLPGFKRTYEAVEKRTDIYPGCFAATPCGPFDILSSDASARALSAYPAVALFGDVDMRPELLAAMQDYVRAGGTLLINVLHMRHNEAFVQAPDLLGAQIGRANWTRLFSSDRILRKADIPGVTAAEFHEPWFAAIEVEPKEAQVVAATPDGHPVLLRHKSGAGTVYLSTPEYMQEGWGNQERTLGFFRAFLAGLAGGGSVRVTGDDLSWVASRQGQDTVVAIVNHARTERAATLTVPAAAGKPVAEGPNLVVLTPGASRGEFRLTVPPEDVVVVRLPGP